jgi:hypothetical protein
MGIAESEFLRMDSPPIAVQAMRDPDSAAPRRKRRIFDQPQVASKAPLIKQRR